MSWPPFQPHFLPVRTGALLYQNLLRSRECEPLHCSLLRSFLLISQLTSFSHMIFSRRSFPRGCPSVLAHAGASLAAVSKPSPSLVNSLNFTSTRQQQLRHHRLRHQRLASSLSVRYHHGTASRQGDGSNVSLILLITSGWISLIRYRHHCSTARTLSHLKRPLPSGDRSPTSTSTSTLHHHQHLHSHHITTTSTPRLPSIDISTSPTSLRFPRNPTST